MDQFHDTNEQQEVARGKNTRFAVGDRISDKKNETRGRVPAKTGSHKRPRSEESVKSGSGSRPGLQAPANKHANTESTPGGQVSVLPIEVDEEL